MSSDTESDPSSRSRVLTSSTKIRDMEVVYKIDRLFHELAEVDAPDAYTGLFLRTPSVSSAIHDQSNKSNSGKIWKKPAANDASVRTPRIHEEKEDLHK